MKKHIVLLVALSALNFGFAQTEVAINYNQKKDVLLNGKKIDKRQI